MEDDGTAKMIGSWQGLDLSTFNATGTLTNIVACVSEACNESGREDCTGLAETLAAMSNPTNGTSPEIAGSLASNINEYCSATHIQMDGDIAGPGVILSYAFQTSLALLFYFFVKISRTWTRRIINLLSYCGLPSLRHRGLPLQKQVGESIFGAAAISSVAEFHEIQCYFIASIQIATLLCFDSNNPKAAGNSSTSFGQAIFNAETSIILSITSVAPVLLTQFSLQRAGIHWWYTFITMTFTVILAVIIYARQAIVMVSPDGLWDTLVSERAVTSCGMNPAPIVYCGLFDDPGFTTMGAVPVYTGCLVGLIAWFGLLIDQIAYTIRTRFPSVLQKPGILGWVARLLDTSKQNKLGRGLVVLFLSFANLLLLFNVGMYSVLLGFSIRGTDFSNISGWSFGQLVAVMVWTPTMIKYLYYIACHWN
ncbi:uncharacterized protein DNG_05854 [Cephalotrichum gorgonifer]|uniref:Uncharacterized protein n=1 Tax=Cephalotrichum gorgonifer TaxID=2041049 RepID=A0AAE8MZ12_9PEZI|nr:uncharacterized protein DNG_05854 [Cephalotrichum gorgonifer]